MHVASMHERARDHALADGAHEVCCRKYRAQPDVWLAWITARMVRGEPADAKAVLQRAVDALPRARHADLLSKFAQLEFKHGSAERGRTVFDGILASSAPAAEPATAHAATQAVARVALLTPSREWL